jgi:hypothetical protein
MPDMVARRKRFNKAVREALQRAGFHTAWERHAGVNVTASTYAVRGGLGLRYPNGICVLSQWGERDDRERHARTDAVCRALLSAGFGVVTPIESPQAIYVFAPEYS